MTRRKAQLLLLTLFGTPLVAGSIVVVNLAGFYRQHIYPGVWVANIDLGNLDTAAAAAKLGQILRPDFTFLLTYDGQKWVVHTQEDLDLDYNLNQSVQTAKDIDLATWLKSPTQVHLDPVFVLDDDKLHNLIASLSAQINLPAEEPEITVRNGQVTVSPGSNGQEVDERQLTQQIRQLLATGRSLSITLPVRKIEPQLSPEQMETVRIRATKLLGKKLTLKLPADHQSWDIDHNAFFPWLATNGWHQDKIASWVGELATAINRPAQNANFRYLSPGRVQEFRPGRPGVEVLADQLVKAVILHLTELETQRVATITFDIPHRTTEPTLKTGDVNSLGIKELIGRGESDYSGSIPNRVFNLQKAAGVVSGVLVAPGETFSFNRNVGDISAATGYKQAYVIKEGRTVLGDGGGVCQVSSTLFRAALAAGLSIEERWAHAYRVHYYENDRQPGFDATVFAPSVDLKFKNDTEHYLLIQSEIFPAQNKLVYSIYGTGDGRRVEISKARIWDITPPPPAAYQDDPTLPAGKLVQVDWAAWGTKAAFDYKVTRGDEVLQQRTFYSAFRPWRAVFLRGTRTN